MQQTEYTVYWTLNGRPVSKKCTELTKALSTCETLRYERTKGMNISFITLVGENVDMVGEAGVNEVKNGVTPDGVEYTWQKRRDGGQ